MAVMEPGVSFGSHLAGVPGPRTVGSDRVYRYTTTHTDGHPDPLYTWADHGDGTPRGWFELCAFTGYGHVLLIQCIEYRTLHPYKTEAVNLLAPVYWHPSPEYVREIGRQMLEGQRACFAWNITRWSAVCPHAVEIRERVPGGFRIIAQLPTEEERRGYRARTEPS